MTAPPSGTDIVMSMLQFMGLITNSPFNVVLTRMQCQPELIKQKLAISPGARNGLEMVKGIYKKEGALAFWKGNFTSFLYSLSGGAINLVWYACGLSNTQKGDLFNGLLNLGTFMMIYPLMYAEINLINNTNPGFKSYRSVIMEDLKQGGHRKIYKGFLLHYLHYNALVPLGIMFNTYVAKRTPDSTYARIAAGTTFIAVETVKYAVLTVWKRLLMSANNPKPYRTSLECVADMIEEGGLRSFFRGYSVYLAYIALISAGMISEFGTGSPPQKNSQLSQE